MGSLGFAKWSKSRYEDGLKQMRDQVNSLQTENARLSGLDQELKDAKLLENGLTRERDDYKSGQEQLAQQLQQESEAHRRDLETERKREADFITSIKSDAKTAFETRLKELTDDRDEAIKERDAKEAERGKLQQDYNTLLAGAQQNQSAADDANKNMTALEGQITKLTESKNEAENMNRVSERARYALTLILDDVETQFFIKGDRTLEDRRHDFQGEYNDVREKYSSELANMAMPSMQERFQ
jgi:chromosome segregation ATPase